MNRIFSRLHIRNRVLNFLAITAVGLLGGPGEISPAQAASGTTIVAVWSCNPCASLSDLQSAAAAAALKQQWTNYNNAIILMTSLNKPISGYFKLKVTVKIFYGTPVYTYTATPITPDNMSTGTLDNSIFARAAKFTPVVIPPSVPYTEPDPVIVQYIQTQVAVIGGPQISVWHGLTNYPQMVYYNVTNLQTGETSEVYVGDTILVDYGNGYTEQWQFLSPEGGTTQWKRVDGTLMHNGKPVTPPSTKPAASIPGANSWINPDVYDPGTIKMINDLNFCTGVASVAVTSEGVDITSFGFYTFPC